MDLSNGLNDICGNKRRSIGILIIFFLPQRLLTFFIKKVIEEMNAGLLECSRRLFQVFQDLGVVIVLAVVIYSMEVPKK